MVDPTCWSHNSRASVIDAAASIYRSATMIDGAASVHGSPAVRHVRGALPRRTRQHEGGSQYSRCGGNRSDGYLVSHWAYSYFENPARTPTGRDTSAIVSPLPALALDEPRLAYAALGRENIILWCLLSGPRTHGLIGGAFPVVDRYCPDAKARTQPPGSPHRPHARPCGRSGSP